MSVALFYNTMKKLFVSLILLTFTFTISAQEKLFTSKSNTTKVAIERLEKNIPELMTEADVPGMSVALIRDGKLVWTKSFGVKNAETKELTTNKTIFEAASLSKPVFAYAVLKLVDEGKIDLDIPLNKYLGNNYDVGDDERLNKITARRVLSHTTGFPNWRNRDSKTLPILLEPGERFSYSGEGFEYLRKTIEHITKMPLEDFMKKTVFVPLKMNSSTYVWNERSKEFKANRHNSLGQFAGNNENIEPNAAASLLTTAEDYARFLIAVLNRDGLKKQTRREMLNPQIRVDEKCTVCVNRPVGKLSTEIGWGLGIGLETTDQGTSFWHWGDNGNVKAYFTVSDKSKNGIVLFANGKNGLSFLSEIIADSISGNHPAINWLGYERFDSSSRILLKEIINKDADTAIKNYKERRDESKDQDLSESQINQLGYDLMFMKKLDEAIKIFELNTNDFPESANVWDSLAEANMNKGNKELAIKYYEKSLKLNPENKNAVEKLKELNGN